MKLLLDTSVLLLVLAESPRIGADTHQLLADPLNEVFVSAATAWEIAIKIRLGKLEAPANVVEWLPAQIANNRLTPLPISIEHASGVERLPLHHKDPFDRLLISQALAENLAIVSTDAQLEPYPVRLISC